MTRPLFVTRGPCLSRPTLGSAAARSVVRCMLLLHRSGFKRGPSAHEHDLACHASLPEQLLRVSCLDKRKSLRDERPDLLLLKEVEQGDQVLSKPFRFPPFERLDAVGDHPFPAREKPAAGDVQRVNRDSMQAIATTRAA